MIKEDTFNCDNCEKYIGEDETIIAPFEISILQKGTTSSLIYKFCTFYCMKEWTNKALEDKDMLIEKIFTYHPPKDENVMKFIDIREKAKEFGILINNICPDSREKSLAFTKLEEVVMWANASLARN